MAYRRITDLPAVLRRAGIEVVLHEGWKSRGLSTSSRFEPRSLVWHHDASAPGDSPGVPAYMIRNFANAGAQIWIDREGRWHFIASGRAAHAGRTLPGRVDNYTSVGIETDHTTGEEWAPDLLDSLRKGTAAILAHWRTTPVAGLHFHKTICDPPGRKVDPDGLSLGAERGRVAALMVRDRRPAVSLRRAQVAATTPPWRGVLAPAVVRDRGRIKAALKAEGLSNYRQWQTRLGYRGADADGIPGRESLTRLGTRRGFRVIA